MYGADLLRWVLKVFIIAIFSEVRKIVRKQPNNIAAD
jgi:hypothetical protein